MTSPVPSSSVLSVRQLTKTYGVGEAAYRALRGIDLDVSQGEFLMLVGPSGSGKTTLLSILGAVLKSTSGTYQLFGEEVSKASERQLYRIRAEKIGFIFQGHNLITSMSALDNIALMLAIRGYGRKEALMRSRELLEGVGLGSKLESRPQDLSGGQRQRIAIARALAGDPPLILADEPTAALDAENGRLVSELMKKMSRERGDTVVVVTHDDRIFDLADRIVHIEDGKIVQGASHATKNS